MTGPLSTPLRATDRLFSRPALVRGAGVLHLLFSTLLIALYGLWWRTPDNDVIEVAVFLLSVLAIGLVGLGVRDLGRGFVRRASSWLAAAS